MFVQKSGHMKYFLRNPCMWNVFSEIWSCGMFSQKSGHMKCLFRNLGMWNVFSEIWACGMFAGRTGGVRMWSHQCFWSWARFCGLISCPSHLSLFALFWAFLFGFLAALSTSNLTLQWAHAQAICLFLPFFGLFFLAFWPLCQLRISHFNGLMQVVAFWFISLSSKFCSLAS